jgi:hypothetical protein
MGGKRALDQETGDRDLRWAVSRTVEDIEEGLHEYGELSVDEYIEGMRDTGFAISDLDRIEYYIPDDDFDEFARRVRQALALHQQEERRYKRRQQADKDERADRSTSEHEK